MSWKYWQEKNAYHKLSMILFIVLIPLLIIWIRYLISCQAEACMLVYLLAGINSLLGILSLITYIIGRVKK